MSSRRLRPTVDAIEPRLLLSTAHHPAAYTGTIHGFLAEPAPQPPGSVIVTTYEIVKAGGSLTPYGSVSVTHGSALDHGVRIGLPGVFVPVVNRQSIDIDLARHGRGVVGLELVGAVVPLGTALRAGEYTATAFDTTATKTLATRTAILTLPKGLPQHTGQLEPFTLTFRA